MSVILLLLNNFSRTSMQYMRSTGRSRIKIQGVEMGGIRGGFRDHLDLDLWFSSNLLTYIPDMMSIKRSDDWKFIFVIGLAVW